ncbi:hypothetical protein [Ekhidna sp. To15]|uniref:hypothetical protein n=1 Tax=Ekhidna sp. To15 TaxID=3395267 RepID=UPI003F522607
MKALVKACLILLCAIGCTTNNDSSRSTSDSGQLSSVQPELSRNFDYQSPMPKNGELYAVVELGALGLNYFIVDIDKQNRWSLKASSYGRSNIIYGVNTTTEIINKISEFRSEILEYGVNKKNIHIIASSSAVKAAIVEELKSELSSQNLDIDYINSKAEGQYALMATIPKEFIDESFLVDIGSGNTKLSWVERNDTLSIDIHGSKYFLSDVQDTTVFREVRDAILEIPRKNRNLCFMLGGMIYEFVKDDIQKSEQRYFVLKAPNDYPVDNEKLKAANVIYNALFLAPTYSYIFDSQSNFSVGYLLSLEK